MFQKPMSSPQMMRILGFLSAMIESPSALFLTAQIRPPMPSLIPVTLFEFHSTPARTEIVSPCACEPCPEISFIPCQNGHDLRSRPVRPNKLSHDPHGFVRMFEESLIACAEVVQSRLAVGSLSETVLGTFPIANG